MRNTTNPAPPQHRGLVFGRQGVVASASPLATTAGIRVLSQGGNAMDAALATAFVTGVALPDQCGVGGDAFILWYDAKTRNICAVMGAGPSPLGISVSRMREQGFHRMPLNGPYAIQVPGAVSAYRQAWETFGHLDWEELWEPAIGYANNGVPIGEVTARHIHAEREKILANATLRDLFMPGGNPLHPGDILYQNTLATTLKSIAESGGRSFYDGPLGESLLQSLQSQGALFEGPEWTSYRCDEAAPLHTRYHSYQVFTTPLPSQGFILLEALNLLESFPVEDYGYLHPRAIHLMAEALSAGFADRLDKVDMDRREVVETLLSKDYARRRLAAFGIAHTTFVPDASRFAGDTTFIVAADTDGNAACLVHSLGHSFGSGIMANEYGVIMNNRVGRGFYLDPGPNQLAPGKRTMHTLMAWMVTDAEGSLLWAGGTPGGDGQPQWNLQLLVNLLDFKLNPQQACEAPRWTLFPGTDSDVVGKPAELRMESRIAPGAGTTLAQWGYRIRRMDAWGAGGGAQIVGRTAQGGWVAGSDPRVDGHAAAW